MNKTESYTRENPPSSVNDLKAWNYMARVNPWEKGKPPHCMFRYTDNGESVYFGSWEPLEDEKPFQETDFSRCMRLDYFWVMALNEDGSCNKDVFLRIAELLKEGKEQNNE